MTKDFDDLIWCNGDELIYPLEIMDFWANHSISTMHITDNN